MSKKKNKQKKAGLAKRQKNKQDKKRLFKKQAKANKPVKKKLSSSKVKQNIKNLPCLIFEPELREIAFTAQQIEEAKDKYQTVPDQIEAIATPDFLAKLGERVDSMKVRFDEENDINKGMMVYAVDYFINQEKAPAFVNQLIVAMYYEALSQIEDPEAVIETDQLNLFIKGYEATWKERIQEKLEDIEAGDALDDYEEQADEDDFPLYSPFEPLIEEFTLHLKSNLELEGDQVDRAEDDVGALLNDYLEEKEIKTLEELTPRKLKTFLDGWFPRVMHPTDDDLAAMIESLELFFQFAKTKEKLAEERSEEFLEILKERKNVE